MSKAPRSFAECKREVNRAHTDRRWNLRHRGPHKPFAAHLTEDSPAGALSQTRGRKVGKVSPPYLSFHRVWLVTLATHCGFVSEANPFTAGAVEHAHLPPELGLVTHV